MITKAQAETLTYDDVILEPRPGNRPPARWRVTGKMQTWKTRPDEFRLPLKHGLYDYGALTHMNAEHFRMNDKTECQWCNGTGWSAGPTGTKCRECNGIGTVD